LSLADLLVERGIRTALIVDDVCDQVPRAADIDPANPAWVNFNDDLTPADKVLINAEYPGEETTPFATRITDDAYVATVWQLRDRLNGVADPVFATYLVDQATDQKFVDLAKARLEALGLACSTAGREFREPARAADVIVIDLFFGNAQDDSNLAESKRLLAAALAGREGDAPLVILMSRSNRLDAKRDEFRTDVGLLDSAFRIIRKTDLEQTDTLERQLDRLAQNAEDSRRLARFFKAIEGGMATATERTLKLLRNLKLSDVGQIQQLLLSAEGEPTGSYLVDVFDRVLQHEIEREQGIIDAAADLNKFASIKHPPPFLAGSPDLQELVQRTLTQNEKRIQLPGALDSPVTFGDILRRPVGGAAPKAGGLFADRSTDDVFMVMTPVCDLQRGGAPRVLFLVGTLKNVKAQDWSYGDDARTPSILVDGGLHWIKWELKSLETASWDQLEEAFKDEGVRVVARLREAHALELQQRVLAGLGRVGLVAPMPATFPVEVEIYYAAVDGRLTRLAVPELNDGAVCFVGRDDKANTVTRVMLTEGGSDGILAAIKGLDVALVAAEAKTAFTHVTTTDDLRHNLDAGLSLKGVGADSWFHLPSETGAANNIPKMGLIAFNLVLKDEPLKRADLNKAGIAMLIRDVEQVGVARASAILAATPVPSATPTESEAVPAAPAVVALEEAKPG